MPHGMEEGLGPGHSVLDQDPARPQKRHSLPPSILAHDCYGETAGCIKMPLGTEVGRNMAISETKGQGWRVILTK